MEVKDADLSSLKINRNNDENNSSGGSKKVIYLVVGIVILAGIVYFLSGSALFRKEIEVKIATATLTTSSQNNAVLNANGYVVAQRKAAVASKGTGRMIFLGVVEGDKVVKDQIIARLDDSDIKASLDQAKANLKLAQSELPDAENSFNRQKSLYQSKSSSKAEFDAAEYRYNRVLASIEVAKTQVISADVAMENMLIRAPFNGTVLTKNADVGEIVAPFAASASSKAAVVTIADMNSLQVEADVSESNIDRITIHQDCEISLDAYPDRRYEAYVDKIVPTADRSKATVMVKVGFKNYDARVLPEMSAKVLFLNKNAQPASVNNRPVLTIPLSAIVKKNSKEYVYRIVDGLAQEVEIKTGEQFSSFVEIRSGLSSGDKVIVDPPADLKANQKLKIIE